MELVPFLNILGIHNWLIIKVVSVEANYAVWNLQIMLIEMN